MIYTIRDDYLINESRKESIQLETFKLFTKLNIDYSLRNNKEIKVYKYIHAFYAQDITFVQGGIYSHKSDKFLKKMNYICSYIDVNDDAILEPITDTKKKLNLIYYRNSLDWNIIK